MYKFDDFSKTIFFLMGRNTFIHIIKIQPDDSNTVKSYDRKYHYTLL